VTVEVNSVTISENTSSVDSLMLSVGTSVTVGTALSPSSVSLTVGLTDAVCSFSVDSTDAAVVV